MPVTTGGETLNKILLALEILIDQDIDESDKIEEDIDEED